MNANHTISKRLVGASAGLAALSMSALAFAAPGGGPPPPPSNVTIIATLVNFTLFALIIVWAIKNKITPAMQARRDAFQAQANESARLRAEAEALVASYQAKLDAFDQERAQLLDEFRAIGEKERERIIAEANGDAERILADARQLAEREERHAERGIEAKLVERAIDLAVQELQKQANPMVQNRLIERSIDSFKNLKLN